MHDEEPEVLGYSRITSACFPVICLFLLACVLFQNSVSFFQGCMLLTGPFLVGSPAG